MRIERGNVITWTSRAGILEGTVLDIVLDLNAANEVCPWMSIVNIIDSNGKKHSNTRLNANHGYLKMMKVEVLR